MTVVRSWSSSRETRAACTQYFGVGSSFLMILFLSLDEDVNTVLIDTCTIIHLMVTLHIVVCAHSQLSAILPTDGTTCSTRSPTPHSEF